MEMQHPGHWLLLLCIVVVVPLLATRSAWVRRWAASWLQRWGSWLWSRMVVEPAADPLAAELYRLRRLERLHADIARLRRILANDIAMSATRQLGNRLAYDWLLNELARIRRLSYNPLDDQIFAGWDAAPSPSTVLVPAGGYTPQRANVEFLDVGWRS